MTVGVLGGGGHVGDAVAAELRRRGHRAIVLARNAPDGGLHVGFDAVVETLDGPPAGAERAGVGHVVALSAAGAGRAATDYHRLKIRQEAAVRDSGAPFSIVRAAPTHARLDSLFEAWAQSGVLPLMPVPVQPVDHRELAAHLADVVDAGPSGTAAPFVGPRKEWLDRMALRWAEARGAQVRPLPVHAPPQLRDGALLYPGSWTGRLSFGDWLAGERRPSGPGSLALA